MKSVEKHLASISSNKKAHEAAKLRKGFSKWGGPRVVSFWKPEQVQVFVDAADEMGYHSTGTLALLCFDLCERLSDMLDLTWHNYTTHVIKSDGHKIVGYFDFQYRKTNTEKHIPASTRLVERLNTTRKSALNDHIIYSRTDMPMHVGQALHMSKKIKKYANLSDTLRMGDLRRSGLKVAKLAKQVFEIPEETIRSNA